MEICQESICWKEWRVSWEESKACFQSVAADSCVRMLHTIHRIDWREHWEKDTCWTISYHHLWENANVVLGEPALRGRMILCVKGTSRPKSIVYREHFLFFKKARQEEHCRWPLTSHELISRTESRSSGLDPVIRLILSQQANPCEERDSKHNLAQGDTTARINIWA